MLFFQTTTKNLLESSVKACFPRKQQRYEMPSTGIKVETIRS